MSVNRITLGHPEAHEKLTARLYWRVVGSSGYVDAGNVKEYADSSTRSLVTRSRSENGARTVNDEQANICHEAYTFVLDERVPEQEQLISLARVDSNRAQLTAEGETATIENVTPGCWYDVGAFNLANIQAAGSLAGLLEEGDDYDLDLQNGRIFIKTEGQVSTGEDIDLTFDKPGMSLQQHTSQARPLFYCDLIIEEYNQFARMWLRRLALKAYLNVTEFPSHSGEMAAYKVKATAAGPVEVLKRPAAPLPTATGSGEFSSSSSSRSSNSSSGSSQSSQSSPSSLTPQSSSSSSSTLASVTSSSSSSRPSDSSASSSSSSTFESVTSSSHSSSSHSDSYSQMSSFSTGLLDPP